MKLPESHGGKGETFFFPFGGKLAVFLGRVRVEYYICSARGFVHCDRTDLNNEGALSWDQYLFAAPFFVEPPQQIRKNISGHFLLTLPETNSQST